MAPHSASVDVTTLPAQPLLARTLEPRQCLLIEPVDMSMDIDEGPGGGPPVVGVETRRRRRLRYELLGCALRGHLIVGAEQAEQSGHATLLVQPDTMHPGVGWFRCLRCDAWLPMTDTARLDDPADRRTAPPGPVHIPLRGRPLRDRFVLRLIAVDRVVHFLLIGIVGVAIFLFANHRDKLRGEYTRVLNRLQAAVGGPLTDTPGAGLLQDFDKLFAVPTGKLYLYGAAIAVYALVNGIEAVGLWNARRWAEYLTLVETAVFLPIEIHELLVRVSPIKIVTLVLNLAVVAYLLFAHRLFGLRGGGRADRAEKDRDTGWPPLQRTTPWTATTPAA